MDIKKLIKSMTLREKLSQLTQFNAEMYNAQAGSAATGPMESLGITIEETKDMGSTLNFRGTENVIAMQNDYLSKSDKKIPLMFMMDVIHGCETIYPINLALAGSFDTDLARRCAAMAAKESAVYGINVTFAPMVDISRDARWGRVMEGAGEDTYLGCLMAKATVEGYQGDMGKYNISACLKHFAGYGAVEAGRDYNVSEMSKKTLYEYYLPPYKAAVDAGVKMAMTSYNTLDGIPSTGNKALFDGILRKEWGFDGVVISDYFAIGELMIHGFAEDKYDAATKAMNATVDIEMMSANYLQCVEKLIQDGKLTEKQVDDALYRVLKLKDELGLFENPLRSISLDECKEVMLCPEHRALAREAAEKSAVLLKNDGLLPFNKSVKKVAVIGGLANDGKILGSWACYGDPNEAVTVYDGVKNLLANAEVKYAKGCDIDYYANDESGFDEAVKLASECDIVIYTMGEPSIDSGEGNCKADLEIPQIQYKLLDKLMAVNKNVAVVLFNGRPLAIKRLNDTAPAILDMWQPGTEGGNAAARLLFGEVSPQGRLAMCFPTKTGQCPIYYNRYSTGRPRTSERDDSRVYYRSSYLDTHNGPLFTFGYGLTYTKFEYSPIQISSDKLTRDGEIKAWVTVKNTGDRVGNELVQLYTRDLAGRCVRPIRELKGFKWITLNPGQEEKVEFTLTADMLEYYGPDLVKAVENGVFYVFIGTDSETENKAVFNLV